MEKSGYLDFEIIFFERLIVQNPDFIDALIPLAEAYTSKGWHEKGLAIDRRLCILLPTSPSAHYNLACSLALTGKDNEALELLRHSIQLGWNDFQHLKKDPDLKSLHGRPEFQALLTP